MKMEHDIDIARVVAQAMRVAPADGRRRIEVMEERLALAPADFVAGLAELAGVESFGMARLLQGKPAFDHLGFGDCLRLECVILELADGRVYLVVADPFDGALQDRVGNLMPVPPRLAVAHRADIVAYLHRYEESSRAMDSITQAADNSELDEGITDISLRTISNDTSPVVRLVNSTLHDAFKAGASDIHLESGPAGGIVLRLHGDWQAANLLPLRAAFAELVDTTAPLQLDLSATGVVDSALVALVQLLHGHRMRCGLPLTISGAQGTALRVFRWCRAEFVLTA